MKESAAVDEKTHGKIKHLIVWLEKSFVLAALIFVVSFWAIALHHFFTSSVFVFTCDPVNPSH